MTGFDDFDDDETVVHQSTRPGADEFDDDDTFLATQTTTLDPTPHDTGAAEATNPTHPGPPARPGTSSTLTPSSPNPGPPPAGRSSAAAAPGLGQARSLGVLQEQAPLGPGWQPPDRPTSYRPAPYDGPARSRFGRFRLAALILVLGLIGSGLAIGAWLLATGPGGVGP